MERDSAAAQGGGEAGDDRVVNTPRSVAAMTPGGPGASGGNFGSDFRHRSAQSKSRANTNVGSASLRRGVVDRQLLQYGGASVQPKNNSRTNYGSLSAMVDRDKASNVNREINPRQVLFNE